MRIELTAEIVRELLHYNPDTGHFTWKWRDRKWFRRDQDWKSWNAQHAGKRAFSDNKYGYMQGALLGIKVKPHRVVFLYMIGRWPHPEPDHVNRNGLDNRWCNLREVTKAQSTRNRGPYRATKPE